MVQVCLQPRILIYMRLLIGVQKNMEVLSINGSSVHKFADLRAVLDQCWPGDRIEYSPVCVVSALPMSNNSNG